MEVWVGEEVGGVGFEDGGGGLVFGGWTFAEGGDTALALESGQSFREVAENTGVKHGGGGRFVKAGFEGAFEGFGCARKDEAGAGAELARSHRDGSDEALGDRFAAFGHCSGEDEDRIDRAHFGEDGDGLRAGCGGIHKGATACA